MLASIHHGCAGDNKHISAPVASVGVEFTVYVILTNEHTFKLTNFMTVQVITYTAASAEQPASAQVSAGDHCGIYVMLTNENDCKLTNIMAVQVTTNTTASAGQPFASAQLSQELPSFHDWTVSPPHSSPHSTATHAPSPSSSVTAPARSTARSKTAAKVAQDTATFGIAAGRGSAGKIPPKAMVSESALHIGGASQSEAPAVAIHPDTTRLDPVSVAISFDSADSKPEIVTPNASVAEVGASTTALEGSSQAVVQRPIVGRQHQFEVLEHNDSQAAHGSSALGAEEEQQGATQQLPFSIPFSGLSAAFASPDEVTISLVRDEVMRE